MSQWIQSHTHKDISQFQDHQEFIDERQQMHLPHASDLLGLVLKLTENEYSGLKKEM